MQLPHNPAIVLLGIYPRKMKAFVHTENHTQRIITAFFIITEKWKQHRCPSMGEWINKLWYVYITEHYSAIKRNELLIYKTTWRNIRELLCWVKKANPQRLHTVWSIYITFWKWQNERNREQISNWQGLMRGWGKRESECGYKGATWGMLAMIKMLLNLSVSMSISWLWYRTTVLQNATTGKLNTEHMSSLYYFSQLHVNPQIISK